VLLAAIWPANLQDALTAQQGHDLTAKVLDWVRFPLQIPLIWFALQSGRSQPDELAGSPDSDLGHAESE
jgi:uncharacterized membrane protein